MQQISAEAKPGGLRDPSPENPAGFLTDCFGGFSSPWKTAPSWFLWSKMVKSGDCIGRQAGSQQPCRPRAGAGAFPEPAPWFGGSPHPRLQRQTPDICSLPLPAEGGAAKAIAPLHPELSTSLLKPAAASARTEATTIRGSLRKIPAQGSKSKLGTRKKNANEFNKSLIGLSTAEKAAASQQMPPAAADESTHSTSYTSLSWGQGLSLGDHSPGHFPVSPPSQNPQGDGQVGAAIGASREH